MMRREGIVIICLVIFGMLMCFPLLVAASGSSHGDVEGGHESAPWYRGFNLWKAINLGVLFFALYKLGGVAVKRLLHERTHSIEEAIDEAEQDKSDAHLELEVMQQRFASAKDEIEQILERGREDARRSIEDITSSSETSIEAMKKRARDELAQDFIEARQELLFFVATEVVQLAQKQIEKMDLKGLQSSYLHKFQKTVKLQGGNGEGS